MVESTANRYGSQAVVAAVYKAPEPDGIVLPFIWGGFAERRREVVDIKSVSRDGDLADESLVIAGFEPFCTSAEGRAGVDARTQARGAARPFERKLLESIVHQPPVDEESQTAPVIAERYVVPGFSVGLDLVLGGDPHGRGVLAENLDLADQGAAVVIESNSSTVTYRKQKSPYRQNQYGL